MPPDNVEFLFATLQRQLSEMRDEARSRDSLARDDARTRHTDNTARLEKIVERLDSLERWRSYLVGAWAVITALSIGIWALMKEWGRLGKP